ncbi:MAG TPA: serine hydrolase [Thermoleophilaceae bacterium]|nr:serine hydrolase [Thermoleophilaceae bacterium]
MSGKARTAFASLAAAGALVLVGPAHAAKSCDAPGDEWERATPAEAGMDAARLQDALDYGTQNAGFAVRVFRHGCLVGADRTEPQSRETQYESWSLGKSITALVVMRAMTLGLVSPDDPIGSLVPEADEAHGRITVRDILTMTSGLHWNGFRDYNIFTMDDRVRDALTLPVDHEPGTHYEYAQSAVSLLAEAVGRASGRDFADFAHHELMAPLGIGDGEWRWDRDRAGQAYGFMGVQMKPEDYGRLGELMRRGGVWRGRRLLDAELVDRALTPSATNACYGWLIWLNEGKPCIGVRITERPVKPTRSMPTLPPDLFRFSGLFGQLVTTFPTQGIVVVRNGQDRGLVPAGGSNWELELYNRVLAAVTDEAIVVPGDAPVEDPGGHPDDDRGFQNAISDPGAYSAGASQDPLPAPGPWRARAAQLRLTQSLVGPARRIRLEVFCPVAHPGHGIPGCRGTARVLGARGALRYALMPGESARANLRLGSGRVRALRRDGETALSLVARNRDGAAGTHASGADSVRASRRFR